ncbi:Uncharacterised protein [Mycolicibacterium vanbaalenii]|uniref:DUF7159 domain-containing protein n=1 Tax=Mycolicibacterium vanbaalenii TaxID=110539 RepID=A0A5S9R9A8_MYCVN|nr:hypothetical protein [Mycolicibacterium vanbaalenii]CAA0133422.1 Uncharacterised protein [Mycolicibacterium vanbaalenii]
MDAVLGLSVTPSAVGLVLVEGLDADGATIDGVGFDVNTRGSEGALRTCEQAAAAVLRTEAGAADRGHRVRSIGVTWSDDADTEASLLLKSLSDSGFDNIVPVRLSEATDALARGIAEVTGYPTTAVCVIEPEQLIAMIVQTEQGAVQTAVNHTVVTEEDLIGWLSAVFAKADWKPQALVLVGSAEDLHGLRPVLEDALSVPVYTPAEAQLALARGAALACAQNGDLSLGGGGGDVRPASDAGRRARRLVQTGPAAVLAAGLVTFVASASAALALQAAPERTAPSPRPADTSAQTPVAVRGPAPAPPLPAAPVGAAAQLPVPEAPAVPVPQAEPEVAPIPEAPPPPELAPVPEAVTPPPEGAAAPPPLDVPQPPVGLAPPGAPAPEMMPPPVPEERPGILQRIRDRLSGGGDDQQQPAAVPPPPP